MTQLPNLAFIGKAGAGKTTLADIAVKRFGYEKLSFAEPLKVMLDTTTDRARLQEFGTDVVRAYEPDAWVRLFLWQGELRNRFSDEWRPYVVDDARFYNEVTALKADGFIVVRVIAPTATRVGRLKANGKLTDEAQLEHSSETELDGFAADYVIHNPEFTAQEQLVDRLGHIINTERRQAA